MPHGIRTTTIAEGARPTSAIATEVIGVVATATAVGAPAIAALNAAFPLGQAVAVTSLRAAISSAGTAGTLKAVLEGIESQANAPTVVVRIDDVDDVEAGLVALRGAEVPTGLRPRILGIPGLETPASIAALGIAAKRLRGFGYFKPPGATVAEAIAGALPTADRELMAVWPEFAGAFSGRAVAMMLGHRSRVDREIGWHQSSSNILLSGVSGGLLPPISFDQYDDTHDAALLNAANITTMIRRDGWRFWGVRTRAGLADATFAFEPTVRATQAVEDEIEAGINWASDKPLTPRLVSEIIKTIKAAGRRHVASGRLLGFDCWFDRDLNVPDDLNAGKLKLDYDLTVPSPAEDIGLNVHVTGRYYNDFADQIPA